MPTGNSLPAASWVLRHRRICILLWLHVPTLVVFGLSQGETPAHVLGEIAVIGLLAMAAGARGWDRNMRSAGATLGLVTSSAVLVHFSGGMIEAHFHFFVVVVVVSLYQSWLPFLLSIGFVALHHGIVGAIDPASVYNHPAALAAPWKWALIHAGFILSESAACLVAWRANEDALDREQATETLRRRIEHQALHDSLTGLGNRVLLLDRLEHALQLRRRSAVPLAVLFLDLDDFKTVNDTLGHHMGDELLIEVARRLLATVRGSETVARMGGDEFAILLEETDVEQAVEVADRIRAAVHAPMSLQGRSLSIRVSIGIAPVTSSTGRVDVLRDADIAMYAAKQNGGGGCEVFTSDMMASVVNRTQLRRELEDALRLEQFVLHYQPVMEHATEEFRGVEALLRWEHPERGLVSPADFILLAEETGLIVPIGAWVTREATRQTKALQRRLGRPLWVSVNLSPQQLSSDVVGMVEGALADSGLHPTELILEFTETSLMSHKADRLGQLDVLRAKGVRIAIDDFGTGYSSLAYLQRLPVDILKIDRSFVDGISDGPGQVALLDAIISLAHILGLQAIAEGVETAEQASLLSDLGCDASQGYYLCRPLAVEAVVAHLADDARVVA